jgi:hypothetical protein
MPPLASAAAYEVDRAIETDTVPPNAAGAWATLHRLRPEETVAAFREGRGPLAPYLPVTDTSGAVSTIVSGGGSVAVVQPVGLGALASAVGASAGTFKLQTFPSA